LRGDPRIRRIASPVSVATIADINRPEASQVSAIAAVLASAGSRAGAMNVAGSASSHAATLQGIQRHARGA
jgi:hypothetical protein